MAVPTDPAFGSDFDADAFRQAITSTMEMGMATGAEYTATFYWDQIAEYSNGVDISTVPYDFTEEPESIVQAATTLVVPLVTDFNSEAGKQFTALGQIDRVSAVITVLDTYYEDIKTADGVSFGEIKYSIDFMEPAIGLFSVNLYNIHCSPIDGGS